MSDTWCILGNSDGAGQRLATSLLAEGHRVAVMALDVAPFAMLVNRYGDSIFTFEVTTLDAQFLIHAVNTLDDSFGGIDTIAVMPSPDHVAATRRAAEHLADHWQITDLRFVGDQGLVAA